MTKKLLAKHIERAFELLDIIHGDACEPLTVQAKGGYSYFITFTVNFNRYDYVFLSKHKS